MPNPCRLGAGLTLISMPGWLAFRVDGIIFASGRAGTIPFVKSWAYPFDNPTECSGPPHLLGPWGSAGRGRCEWPPHDTAPGRPPCFPENTSPCRCPERKRAPDGAPRSERSRNAHLILDSRNSTCFLATGSYFFFTSLSVIVREFFLVT